MEDERAATGDNEEKIPTTPAVLLTEDQVAEIIGKPRRWLQQSRHRGRDAIPYVKIGRSVRYEAAAVARYVERFRYTSTSNEHAAKSRRDSG